MSQLVTDDVVEVAQRSTDRQHDAAPQCFGYAAGAFTQVSLHHVGLPEFLRTGIENEWLPPLELVIEEP